MKQQEPPPDSSPMSWLPIGYHRSASLRLIQESLSLQGKTVKQTLATF
jgi:hypothetical protein